MSAGRLAVVGVVLFTAAMVCATLDALRVQELTAAGTVLYTGAIWLIVSAIRIVWRRDRERRPPWM